MYRVGQQQTLTNSVGEITMEDGVQVIRIVAKGGYYPREITATANTPTELRIETNGTFDCSASLVIPDIGYDAILPPSGIEKISLTADQATGRLAGRCGMGMYSFVIDFQS